MNPGNQAKNEVFRRVFSVKVEICPDEDIAKFVLIPCVNVGEGNFRDPESLRQKPAQSALLCF